MSEGLELRAVGKRFGGVVALQDVDFDVRPGEIHALIGENGAGKSTLINLSTGVFTPDSGSISLEGRSVRLRNPHDAASQGIHVVRQEAELFPDLSLAENMLLADGLVASRGVIDWKRTYAESQAALDAFEVRADARASAGSLSVGQRVLASIAAAVAKAPKVLFLDEPTASLTHSEAQRLLSRLRELRDQGVAIVYVSHRLPEVLALADRVTTLRDGRRVGTEQIAGLTEPDLVARMVGRELETSRRPTSSATDEIGLRVGEIAVRRGEIVGLYGLIGAGRTELARRAFGLDGGTESIRNPGQAIRAGIAYLPEDRLTQGIFATHSCADNVGIARLRTLGGLGFISPPAETARAQSKAEALQVKLSRIGQPIQTLSGGNQQKLVLGRWLETNPDAIILDEPTRGVDVGAKNQIHRLIGELAGQGKAVLVISSDLPEVLQVSDRIVVMAEGNVVAEFDGATATEAEVVAAALPTGVGAASELAPHRRTFREFGISAALLAIIAFMAITQPVEFATAKNLLDVLVSASIVAIGAIGMTLAIVAGGIDISVGRMLGLVATLTGMAAMAGAPPPVALVLAVGLGAALGTINGFASVLGRIHPIVTTLATMSIYYGLMLQITQGREVQPLPDGFRALADGSVAGIPKVLLWSLGTLAAGWFLLQNSLLGRRLLAVGGSERAAALIGLNVARLRVGAFAMMGGGIGLCALLWAGYYGKVQGNTGAGFELHTIAAAVVGGCSIMGGRGTALGAFLGAVLIALIRNSLVLSKVDSYWQDAFIGGLILLAVLIDLWLPKLRRAR